MPSRQQYWVDEDDVVLQDVVASSSRSGYGLCSSGTGLCSTSGGGAVGVVVGGAVRNLFRRR